MTFTTSHRIIAARHTLGILLLGSSAFALSACTEQKPNSFRLKPVEQTTALVTQKKYTLVKEEKVSVPVTEPSPVVVTVPSPYPSPFASPVVVTVPSPYPSPFASPIVVTTPSPYPSPFASPYVVEEKVKSETHENVTRPIDILWVVDNSSSMEPSQEKLRKAVKGFAQTYLNGTKDIRMAVITTDTYLANPAFAGFLKSVQPHSLKWKSTYLGSKARQASFQNPTNDPAFLSADGVLNHGITMSQLHPLWGPNYAKLQAGIHDGPMPMFCMELPGDFFSGITKCSVRDDQTLFSGPEHCVNPTGSDNMISQCVNTVENNSIHSGRPILSSLPPAGTPADAKWNQQLVNDFIVNVSVGTTGSGSERGLGSLIQFLHDNEVDGSTTKFFRKGSIHMITFLSDEDDQTMIIPANPSPTFNPESGYIHGKCAPTTVDGFKYTLSMCIKEPARALRAVSDIKAETDAFFTKLDGDPSSYFIVPIVARDGKTIEYLQQQQKKMQGYHNAPTDQDVGRRYIEMANLVNNNSSQLSKTLGNGKMIKDIGEDDYSSMLRDIGETITHVSETTVKKTVMKPATRIEMQTVSKILMKQVTHTEMRQMSHIEMQQTSHIEMKQMSHTEMQPTTHIEMRSVTHNEEQTQIVPVGPIELPRTPYGTEKMIVQLCHAGGACENVPSSKFSVDGKMLTVTDQDWLKTVLPTDSVTFLYQPKSQSN